MIFIVTASDAFLWCFPLKSLIYFINSRYSLYILISYKLNILKILIANQSVYVVHCNPFCQQLFQ